MKKIAISGVHGAGKTTLAYRLAAHYKMRGSNVKLIHESARENCPFPLNAEATEETCLWNFHKQFLNELEAVSQGYELAICDRSVLDTFVYYHAVNPKNQLTHNALMQAKEWLSTYDLFVALEPDEGVEIAHDGIRATDHSYQLLIRDGFREVLASASGQLEDKVLFKQCDDVFDERRCQELLSLIEQEVSCDSFACV